MAFALRRCHGGGVSLRLLSGVLLGLIAACSALGQTYTLSTFAGGGRSASISVAGVSVVVSQAGLPDTAPSIAAVTNGASNLTGAIAPGEIIVVYGLGLGPAQITQAHLGDDGRFGTQLAGTSVQFNGIPAPMIYTWDKQVAAVVPYTISGSTAQVTVVYQGQTSAAVSVPIASSAPGIFTLDSTGKGQAAAINQDGFTSNTAASPAKVTDVISLYATGEGQTTPGGVDGEPASVPLPHPNLPVSVTIGGQTVQPQYAGGAPGEVAGVIQINVEIPTGIQTGNAVPVVVQVGSVSSQPGVTIAVADPAAPLVARLDPSSVHAGSAAMTLDVTGSGFQDNVVCAAVCGLLCPARSVITFDQTDVPTQFLSPTQLQAVVPPNLLSTARSVSVTVKNPVVIQCQGTENLLSDPVPFTIVP